jgi:hypothetical protein
VIVLLVNEGNIPFFLVKILGKIEAAEAAADDY